MRKRKREGISLKNFTRFKIWERLKIVNYLCKTCRKSRLVVNSIFRFLKFHSHFSMSLKAQHQNGKLLHLILHSFIHFNASEVYDEMFFSFKQVNFFKYLQRAYKSREHPKFRYALFLITTSPNFVRRRSGCFNTFEFRKTREANITRTK